MRRNYQQKESSFGKLLFLAILIILAAGAYQLYNSPMFEKEKPQIVLKKSIFWNIKKPIEVSVSDNNGIKNVIALLSDGEKEIEIINKTFQKPPKTDKLNITMPKIGLNNKNNILKLTVKVTDSSKWNFFEGNKNSAQSIIQVDTKKPEVFPLISSYGITKGGAALTIFKAKDKNLKELYIETNFGKKFKPTPFYKEGYYISLVAWPLTEKRFSAKIIATDKAGNKTKSTISFFLKNKKYRTSTIKASDNFINGKITDLAEDREEITKNLTPAQKLNFINAIYRDENNKIIEDITTKVDKQLISDLKIQPFYPLKNGKVVASHGDHRYYSYKGKVVSESYHLGLDLASTKMADILITNPGVVVFANYNGIYGNNLIVYHGLGLYSLYGHCSSILAQKGTIVDKWDAAAKTGATGLALGDHLHFSILVQGIFVRPAEWMDKKWIQVNITDIINGAKKIIDKQ